MNRRIFFLCTLATAMAACSSVVVVDETGPPPAPPLPSAEPYQAPPPPPVVACLSDGEKCESEGAACCAGSFCAQTGYGFGHCAGKVPEGSYCSENDECSSGVCGDYVCRSATCVSIDEPCTEDTQCCGGFCTGIPQSYVPDGFCHVSDQPAGAPCETNLWCASGSCADSTCL